MNTQTTYTASYPRGMCNQVVYVAPSDLGQFKSKRVRFTPHCNIIFRTDVHRKRPKLFTRELRRVYTSDGMWFLVRRHQSVRKGNVHPHNLRLNTLWQDALNTEEKAQRFHDALLLIETTQKMAQEAQNRRKQKRVKHVSFGTDTTQIYKPNAPITRLSHFVLPRRQAAISCTKRVSDILFNEMQ